MDEIEYKLKSQDPTLISHVSSFVKIENSMLSHSCCLIVTHLFLHTGNIQACSNNYRKVKGGRGCYKSKLTIVSSDRQSECMMFD